MGTEDENNDGFSAGGMRWLHGCMTLLWRIREDVGRVDADCLEDHNIQIYSQDDSIFTP